MRGYFWLFLFLFSASVGLVLSETNRVFAQSNNLEYYINEGLKNSPLLKDYGNQVLANTTDSLITRAGLKPQIGASSQVSVAPYKANYFGYDSSITNGGTYSALISVNQSLINKKYKNGQFRQINLQNQSLKLNARITETDLKKSITRQYITCYADYSLWQFNKTVLEQLSDEQKIIQQLVNSGVYMQSDYLNLTVTIAGQEVTVKQGELQYKNDLDGLNELCGIADTTTVNLAEPVIVLQNGFNINNSPVWLQLGIDSLKNINNKLLIDLNYRPRLDAFLDAGFMSIRPQNIPYNFGTSFGLNFSIPIYDGKQRKLQYDKISLAENTRTAYRDFYLSQYQQQKNSLTRQLTLIYQLIDKIKMQVNEQKNLIDLYKEEMDKGLVRFADYILAVNNYVAAQNNLTQNRINTLKIINEMNYLK